MRTTLDIDEDILLAVKERAREERRTAGQVISQLAREALNAPAPSSTTEFFGFRPLPKRGGVVTNELINQLREELGE
jgi:hypothetical protein